MPTPHFESTTRTTSQPCSALFCISSPPRARGGKHSATTKSFQDTPRESRSTANTCSTSTSPIVLRPRLPPSSIVVTSRNRDYGWHIVAGCNVVGGGPVMAVELGCRPVPWEASVGVSSLVEVSERLVGSPAFKAGVRGDPS